MDRWRETWTFNGGSFPCACGDGPPIWFNTNEAIKFSLRMRG
jgi:hypothetical protein